MPKKLKTIRRYALYCALRTAAAVLRLVPYRACVAAGGLLGRLGFAFARRERTRALAHLDIAFGDLKTAAEKKSIAKACFVNLGRSAFEIVKLSRMPDKFVAGLVEIEEPEKFEELRALRASGASIIMLTGHIGNWELLAAYFSLQGLNVKVIGRRIYFPKYNVFIVGLRARNSIETIYQDESPRRLLRALKDGCTLGILADQDVRKIDGVFVDFFGREAYTPAAPVSFALARGLPLRPVFLVRAGRKHRLVLPPPLVLEEEEEKEKTVLQNTQKWSKIFEDFIRAHPTQWVWMHRRWRTTRDKVEKADG